MAGRNKLRADYFLSRPADGQIKTSTRQKCAAAILLAATAQFVLFGYFVIRTEIRSPISDSFAYIGDYLQFRSGEVSLLEYLWQAHAEHHLVWIRLLTWADVAIFHTRAIPFTIAATLAIAATALLIWSELRRAESKLGATTGLGLLAPMVVLNAANAIDCSVPINTTYTFTVFFAVFSLVLFSHAEEAKVKSASWPICGIVATLAASFGTAAGLLMWPILLWLAGRERLGWAWKGTLAGLGVAYCLFYLQGLQFLELGSAYSAGLAKFFSIPHLQKLTDYFFAFLGLPFTRDPRLEKIGRLFGIILFLAGLSAALLATFSNRLNTRIDRIAVGMILLAIGAAALAALGRSDMIEEVKVPVRYTIFATMLHAGLLCILLPWATRIPTVRNESVISAIGLSFVVTLLILQVFIGRAAIAIADTISRDADCFAQGAQHGSVSQIVTRWPEDASKVLVALRRQGLWAPRTNDCTAR
jgi:hypothetical protein